MKHYGDITKLKGGELPVVDVITGGSPCQDLSIAGKRAGLDGERSGLFMDQIRIIKEMREHDRTTGRTTEFIRPRYMVWENVPGAFSSGSPKGADFQVALTEIARIAEPKAPDVPLPEKGWPHSGLIYDEMGRWSIAWRLHDAQHWGVAQRRKRIALVADFGGLSAGEICFERNGMRWDTTESGEAGENAPETAPSGVGSSSEGQIIGLNRERPGELAYGISSKATNIFGDEIAPTLVSSLSTPVGNTQDGFNVVAMDVGWLQVVTAVDCRSASENPNVNGTLQAKESGGFSVNYQNTVRVGAMVRRLTPLECERLQGFPDGWTDIGDWIDTKGKKHKASDSARYKALGNSIAVGYANNASGFWCWLLKRISAQYERNATLGSLFDGIGGFPLAWEHYNGKGSALWASEIEEFCIAVTKKHFGEE